MDMQYHKRKEAKVKYDPFVEPNAERWLEGDETEKRLAVIEHHRRARVELPNEQIHAVIHVVVENQAAMGNETPVAETLQRLMGEGLDRHDAVHAIGSVLAEHMWELMRKKDIGAEDPNAAYFEQLRNLTAQKWYDEYGDLKD
jgi:hypothetical protein